jgi:hypothetical protein
MEGAAWEGKDFVLPGTYVMKCDARETVVGGLTAPSTGYMRVAVSQE